MAQMGIAGSTNNTFTLSKATQKTDASIIKNGAKIGLLLDAGPIDHPIYKTANLYGVISLVMAQGQYSKPAVLEDLPRLTKFVADSIPRYRNLWPTLTTKDIAIIMRDYVVNACFCRPEYDMCSPKMRVQIEHAIFGFTFDDVVDNNPEDFHHYTHADIRQVSIMFDDLFNGAYENYEDLPQVPAKYRTFAEHIYKSLKFASKQWPEFSTNSAYYRNEIKAGVRSHSVLAGRHGNGFSPFARAELDSNHSGVGIAIELCAAIENLNIPKEVRDDIVFQRLKSASGLVSKLMNELVGLPRDIRLNQVVESSILIKVVERGVPLQQAFEEGLRALEEQCNDLRLCAQILMESYPEIEEDLGKYIRIAENMLDGQLYANSVMARYGYLNMKLVEISVEKSQVLG